MKRAVFISMGFFVVYIVICAIHALHVTAKPKIVKAVESNDIEYVTKYLKNGGDPNVLFPTYNISKNDDPRRRSLLFIAIEQQNLDMCKLLVQNGADTTKSYQRKLPLFKAVIGLVGGSENNVDTQFEIILFLATVSDIHQTNSSGINFMQYAQSYESGRGKELYDRLIKVEKFARLVEPKRGNE